MINKIKKHKFIIIVVLIAIVALLAFLFYPFTENCSGGVVRDSTGKVIVAVPNYCFATNNFQKIRKILYTK